MSAHRKLTAIMFTDMQGYTAMMQEDEKTAIAVRNRHREIFKRVTAEFRGRIIQYFGDGTLTIFDSTVDAVSCALELQKSFRESPIIPVRIGLHVGDIVLSEDDIIGDAVNIASRIESICLPGSVFFSNSVNDQLRSHKRFSTKYLDVFQFKNVQEALPVFALIDEAIVVPDGSEVSGSLKWSSPETTRAKGLGKDRTASLKLRRLIGYFLIAALLVALAIYAFKNNRMATTATSDSDKTATTIAILPIQNLSGIEQNDLLCEALMDEMIRHVSNSPKLGKVVPKSLIQDYIREGVSLNEISNTLQVGFIVEGALHYSDSLYSLDLRLVDPIGQTYLWSNRYRYISQQNYIAEMQSTIGTDLTAHINKNPLPGGLSPNSEEITGNKDAYDLLVRANTLTNKLDKESFYQALPLYEKALQLDPNLSEAYRGLGRVYLMGGLVWGIFKQEEAAEKAKEYLQRSLALKPTLEASQFLLVTRFFFDQDYPYVDEHLPLVAIMPDIPDGAFYTLYCTVVGRFEESIRYSKKYIKHFPDAGNGFAQIIRAYFLSGKLQEADSLMKRNDFRFQNDQFYMRDVAMVHLHRGNMKAFMAMNKALQTNFLDHAAVHLFYDAVALNYSDPGSSKVQERLKMLQQQYDQKVSGSPAWFLAMYYLYTGDDTAAFVWLQKSFERKEVEMVWYKTEYLLQSYRKAKDPRYMAIYNQITWPE